MSTGDRRGPVKWGDLAEEVLTDLWNRTCRFRAARGEPPPPEHLNPKTQVERNPWMNRFLLLLYDDALDASREHGPDWSEWTPGSGRPSCKCGFAGTPEACRAARIAAKSEGGVA